MVLIKQNGSDHAKTKSSGRWTKKWNVGSEMKVVFTLREHGFD